MEFKFTGLVSPRDIRLARNRTVAIPVKLDSELYKAVKKARPGKTGVADYAIDATKEFLGDLDSVLLAAMDEASRQLTMVCQPTTASIDAEVAEMLDEAETFLKAKNYKRMGRGTLMVACVLLKADKDGLIPKQK